MAEWIPVSERLPDVDVDVFVTTTRGDMRIYRRISRLEGFAWWLDNCRVIAWMPLPEPYTEKINDIVEVVRCKDCKHYYKDDGNVVVYRCELCHEDMRDDFYCSDGERR